MKYEVLFCAALAWLAATDAFADAKIYQCIRPDGTVVCTVRDTSGDPSVTCNYECPDCNMVCVAQSKVVREGDKTTNVPSKLTPEGHKRQPGANGGAETPQACRERYEKCVAKCRSNPLNKTKYDVDACISSCEATFSGCGTQ